MSRRLRIEHDGDIVGVRTRVFVDEVVRTPGDAERPTTVEVVDSAEITEAVSEIRLHPMKVGEIARADVVVYAHRLDIDVELGSLIVRDPKAGTVSTRWRVGQVLDDRFTVELVVDADVDVDPDVIEAIEKAAAAAGLELERTS